MPRLGARWAGLEQSLTLAGLVSAGRLVARLAAAAPDGYHPLAFPVAVQPGGAPPCLAPASILLRLRVGHTGAHGRHQGGAPGPAGLRLREGGEGAEHGGAGVGEELDGHEGQAGPGVLEGHVEAALRERPEAPLLDVELQPGPLPGAPGPHRPGRGAWEALVGRDGVHLGPALEVPGGDAVGAVGLLRLAVVKGEGLPAGAPGRAQTGTGAHGEVQADVGSLRPAPLHEVCLQPVVLPGARGGPCHVACLEGPGQAALVVQDAHFIPLQGGGVRRGRGPGLWGGRSLIPLVSTQGFLPQGAPNPGSRVGRSTGWGMKE